MSDKKVITIAENGKILGYLIVDETVDADAVRKEAKAFNEETELYLSLGEYLELVFGGEYIEGIEEVEL